MSNIKEVFRTGEIIAEGVKKGLEKGMEEIKEKGAKYLKNAAIITLITVIPSIVLFSLGISNMNNWWIFAAAIWRGIFTVALLLFLAPAGITFEFIRKGGGAIERYFKIIVAITVIELCFAFVLMMLITFAIKIDSQMIPPLILGLYIVGILAAMAFNPKHVALVVIPLLLILVTTILLSGNKIEVKLPEISEPPKPPGISSQPEPEPSPSPGDHSALRQPLPPPAPIIPLHDIAVIISNSLDDSELIASALREKGKDAVSATSFTPNLARYIIKGEKSVKFALDRTFGESGIVEARVSFDIQIIDAQSGTVIKKIHVIKSYGGLSRESAERTTTKSALDSVNEKLS